MDERLCFGALLLLAGVLHIPALEIDITESFEFIGAGNGVTMSRSSASHPIYTFEKSKATFIAKENISKEFLDLLAQYDQFIISFYVKPKPHNKGTLIWIQDKKTAQTLFGLWFRAGMKAKLSMPHFVNRKTEHMTFHNIGNLKTGEWQYLVIHVKPLFGLVRKVDLYVNCEKVASMESPFGYQNAYGKEYEMRIGQRGVQHFTVARWRGSISKFLITVNRNVKKFLVPEKCHMRKELDAPPYRKEAAANAPPLSRLSPKPNSLTQKELGTLLEAFKSGNKEAGLVKEILDIVKDVREIQSNQVGELKNLRGILELLTKKNPGSVASNALIASTANKTRSGTKMQNCNSSPCFPFVKCVNIAYEPGYQCGTCPPGLAGDGINCTDVDECKYRPCSEVSTCMNRVPGYVCSDCPFGYRGESIVGLGIQHAKQNRQICEDIDECKENKHNCDRLAKCINTKGGYRCGPCKAGYAKNAIGKCRRIKMCSGPPGSKANPCSMYASCQAKGNTAICECRIGFVGNGVICNKDSDMDGFPDIGVNCTHTYCKKDNCPELPNSGQTDSDQDGIGDVCDDDIDGDGIYNKLDKCPYMNTRNQADADNDGVGDLCDNCVLTNNADQIDMDNDGIGDVCDNDVDGDGISNSVDNCPFVKNKDQLDDDEDGYGNACDNCPAVKNSAQRDTDQNGHGDACDDGLDSDKDGILNRYDNCQVVENAAQLDSDGDGIGDACDNDDDNDDLTDSNDNCPLVSNPRQLDLNNNGIGDACEGDIDGDSVHEKDHCPRNKFISTTNFTNGREYLLAKLVNKAQQFPKWTVRSKGTEVLQEKNGIPSAFVGNAAHEGFDFSGVMFVQTQNDDDIIGLVFGYQGPSHFYLISWKQADQIYWQNQDGRRAVSTTGIEIKLVKSSTGPGPQLRNALWHSGNYTGQTTLLWKDANRHGWKDKVPYYFILKHRPQFGLMRLQIYQQANLLVDSGYIVNLELKGGKIGFYAFSQENVVWSNLQIRCNDDVPKDLLKFSRRSA